MEDRVGGLGFGLVESSRMRPQFEVSMIIVGEQDARPEHLKYAVQELLRRAVKTPPDRRFDWGSVHFETNVYYPA